MCRDRGLPPNSIQRTIGNATTHIPTAKTTKMPTTVLNMLVSAVLGAEPHQVLVPIKRLFLISKPSMCPDTSTRHFAPGDRLIWFQGSLENSQTNCLWIEILDGFSARSSN